MPLANARQVSLWFLVSGVVAGIMLSGVVVVANLLPADPYIAHRSQLINTDPTWWEARYIFARNLLVLALHFLACYVGAIVGRPFHPGKMGRIPLLHQELPAWVANGALIYALFATLASVALQTTAIGFALTDIAALFEVSPGKLVLLVLPHAIPELIGVFLPLGLFLIQTKRRQLRPLDRWSWQAAAISLPIVAAAAMIETFITPNILVHFLR